MRRERRRIRRAGETAVPLPQDYAQGVFFVGRRGFGKEGAARIDGTSFLVTIVGERLWHPYVVTAGHVVEGAEESFIRIPTLGGPVDVTVPDWISHGVHDVAVAPIDMPHDTTAVATGLDQFIDTDSEEIAAEWRELELGDIVYFIGLLGKIPEMVARNIPIVRAGTLGALWQEKVPVRRSPAEASRLITAHLIDCRSFGGFSGSPCYIQKSRAAVVTRDDGRPGITTRYWTLLLGLIGGHFDDWAKTRSRESIGADPDDHEYAISDDIMAPVGTGVGYVIPAEFIRETLMREELVAMRADDEKAAERIERRALDEDAATMDSLAGDSEFDRFQKLTERLVNTPKSQIDEKDKGES